jgi:DNA repair/transcription protein MET18/MMS19
LKLGLFIVRYVYCAATAGPRGSWDERALVQLSQMAALTLSLQD